MESEIGKPKLASEFIKQLISKPKKIVDNNGNSVPKSFIRPI
jgi:hypothetical protein